MRTACSKAHTLLIIALAHTHMQMQPNQAHLHTHPDYILVDIHIHTFSMQLYINNPCVCVYVRDCPMDRVCLAKSVDQDHMKIY